MLNSIVDVQITRATAQITRAGFGVPLIMGVTQAFAERVRIYSSVTAMLVDFAPTDDEVLMATAIFAQNPKLPSIKVGRRLDAPLDTVEVALQAIIDEDPDWYLLLTTSRLKAEIEDIAAFIEATSHFYLGASQDADVITVVTTDVASSLQTANFDRTALIWKDDVSDFPDGAWAGKCLPFDPGSKTWKFKNLNGVAATVLTDAELAFLLGKNANTYTKIAGVDITQEGIVASGEFIDIIRGIDWLAQRMAERIFLTLINNPKVPYTDAGVSLIDGDIRAQLQEGVGVGLIAADPPFNTTPPKVADVDPVDRAARLLPDMDFSATLAGAVHKTEVRGLVTV